MTRAIAVIMSCLAVVWGPLAFGQNFPSRPVTIVVPYGPGGVPDVLARTLAARMKEALGQPVVIENKPGAGAMIGTAEVARAVPDGHTLVINGTALALRRSLYKTVTYDAERDLVPVARIADAPHVLYVAPDLGISSLSEFVAKYKDTNPLNYGSPGVGTGPHLAAEVVKARLGLKAQHIPYPSGGAVFNDLIAGRVQFTLNSAQFRGFVDSGKVKALAVTGTKRMDLMQDVPTFSELGHPMPELDAGAWFGLFAPAGTPAAVVAGLNRAVVDTLADQTVRHSLILQGFIPVGSSPEEARNFLHQEIERWPAILARAGISAQ